MARSSARGASQGTPVAGVVSYAEFYGRSVALGGGIMKVQAAIAVTPTGRPRWITLCATHSLRGSETRGIAAQETVPRVAVNPGQR